VNEKGDKGKKRLRLTLSAQATEVPIKQTSEIFRTQSNRSIDYAEEPEVRFGFERKHVFSPSGDVETKAKHVVSLRVLHHKGTPSIDKFR
jgi:hypothetical protein